MKLTTNGDVSSNPIPITALWVRYYLDGNLDGNIEIDLEINNTWYTIYANTMTAPISHIIEDNDIRTIMNDEDNEPFSG